MVCEGESEVLKECVSEWMQGSCCGQWTGRRRRRVEWYSQEIGIRSCIVCSDFGAGLDKNYCRNPDDLLTMPWCYTDKECQREYCDVCNVGMCSY